MPNCIICGHPFFPRNQVQKLCGAAACKREQNRRLAAAAKKLKQAQEPEYIKLPNRSGQVECLKCGQEFLSPDRRAIRICNNCKAIARGIGAWQPQEVWG